MDVAKNTTYFSLNFRILEEKVHRPIQEDNFHEYDDSKKVFSSKLPELYPTNGIVILIPESRSVNLNV